MARDMYLGIGMAALWKSYSRVTAYKSVSDAKSLFIMLMVGIEKIKLSSHAVYPFRIVVAFQGQATIGWADYHAFPTDRRGREKRKFMKLTGL